MKSITLKLGTGLSALVLAGVLSTHAATTVVVGVGTIPHSELFDGPATLTVRQLLKLADPWGFALH